MSSKHYILERVIDMNENAMEPSGLARDTTPKSRRSERQIPAMALVWAVSLVGSTFLLTIERLSGPIAWLVAALPSIAAVFVLVAFLRFLQAADEVQRTIQLQALALACGGGFFLITGYRQFEKLGAPATDDLLAVFPFLYIFGIFLAWQIN